MHEEAHTFGFVRYDHHERLSAKEAMSHMYFAPVLEAAKRDAQAKSSNQASSTGFAV